MSCLFFCAPAGYGLRRGGSGDATCPYTPEGQATNVPVAGGAHAARHPARHSSWSWECLRPYTGPPQCESVGSGSPETSPSGAVPPVRRKPEPRPTRAAYWWWSEGLVPLAGPEQASARVGVPESVSQPGSVPAVPEWPQLGRPRDIPRTPDIDSVRPAPRRSPH